MYLPDASLDGRVESSRIQFHHLRRGVLPVRVSLVSTEQQRQKEMGGKSLVYAAPTRQDHMAILRHRSTGQQQSRTHHETEAWPTGERSLLSRSEIHPSPSSKRGGKGWPSIPD